MTLTGRSDRMALPWALAAMGLWSTVATAFKIALRELDPLDLLAMAALVSWAAMGITLLFRTWKRGVRPPSNPRASWAAAALGLLNPVLYYLILFAAYHRLPAQVAQPLNYTWPLFLALMAAPLAGRVPSLRSLAALLVSLFGVALISSFKGGPVGAVDTLGMALALGSGLLWALYWLLGERLGGDGPRRLFLGFSAGCGILLVLWILRGRALPISPAGWIATLWTGLFEMGITFLFWNRAMERAERPALIGNVVYLGPVLSLVWIHLILDEPIRWTTAAGLAIILGGIFLGRRTIR